MLSFENDYAEGAHEKILARLIETNREQLPGYGTDHYCAEAKEKIRNACECPDADVFFLVGGTQTNATVIDGMLAPYEGVIAASTGHVSLHEAGAIEYTGHKVITLPQHDGKIHAAELEACLRGFWEDESHEHMVFPGMVYLSHPTEYGTLYTAAELEDLSAICHTHQIPLYMDGARRRLLHRRNQSRSPVRRSRHLPPPRRAEAFLHDRQATRRAACQGASSGHPV